MRITNVETFIAGNPWKNWLFTKVHTDEGLYGIGEGTINFMSKTVETAIHELRPQWEGMDPFQPERLVQRMFRDVYTDGGQVHKHAVSAIEVACWDIIGKSLGKPIYELLGGQVRQKVRAYANGWYRGPRTPESFHEKAKAVVKRGYTALKFDPFGSAYQITDLDDEALAIDIIAAVRDAVGPSVDVLVEGHCRFSTSTALKFARKMEPSNPTWFEEPTPHHKIDALIRVAKESPVPIATGESLHTKYEFAELLKHDVIHILQPEPLACGGIWSTRMICDMVDAHYGVVAPHGHLHATGSVYPQPFHSGNVRRVQCGMGGRFDNGCPIPCEGRLYRCAYCTRTRNRSEYRGDRETSLLSAEPPAALSGWVGTQSRPG
jgi:galactonate dehydratase